MTGSASCPRSADAAAVARDRLDRAGAIAAEMEAAQRSMIAALLDLWPTSAWVAAGAASAKAWLLAYTGVSDREAFRLERIAGLCDAHPVLADAVLSGVLSLRRTEKLALAVTKERAPFLAGVLPALLELNESTTDESAFDEALRYWTSRVEEHLAPRRDHPHQLVACQRLFGGGEIHADLTPSAFVNVMAAVDAWTQAPDPADAPTSGPWPNAAPTRWTTWPTSPSPATTTPATGPIPRTRRPGRRTPSTAPIPATTSTKPSAPTAPVKTSTRWTWSADGSAGPSSTDVDAAAAGSAPAPGSPPTSTSTCAPCRAPATSTT